MAPPLQLAQGTQPHELRHEELNTQGHHLQPVLHLLLQQRCWESGRGDGRSSVVMARAPGTDPPPQGARGGKDGGAAQGVPVEPMPKSLPRTTDIRVVDSIFTVQLVTPKVTLVGPDQKVLRQNRIKQKRNDSVLMGVR